jgi:predicted metal-dependent HD superfamily phosphohydrolase
VQRIVKLVLASRHDAPPHGRDAALLVDIDLAILGSPPERFERYERGVRLEYGHVPEKAYR